MMNPDPKNVPYPPQPGYPGPNPYAANQAYNPNVGYPPQPGFYPPQQPPMYPGYGQQPQPGFAYPQPPQAQGFGYEQPYVPPTYPQTSDDEPKGEELPGWQGFSDKSIRRLFIRKVYMILLIQLSFTFGIVALFTFSDPVKKFTRQRPSLYILAYVSFLVFYIVLACCQSVRRNWPTNMICFTLFTISFTYVVATIASQYNTYSVVTCFGICASCCLVITLFSFNTKYDLTSWLGILVILSWCLFLFGMICIFASGASFPMMHKIYSGIGAVLFMLFLAVDTQMLMGGKKYSLSPEEHIFAALQLYLDIMYIFIMLLGLFGKRD